MSGQISGRQIEINGFAFPRRDLPALTMTREEYAVAINELLSQLDALSSRSRWTPEPRLVCLHFDHLNLVRRRTLNLSKGNVSECAAERSHFKPSQVI